MSANVIGRYSLLLGVPLTLMFLEFWHPVGFKNDVFNQLLPQINWWIILHVLQLPLFALLGMSIDFLLEGLKSLPARISRVAIWLFILLYATFNAIDGIGTGLLIEKASELSPAEQAPIAHAAQLYFNDQIFGGTHSWLSESGGLCWLIAIVSAAWALYLDGRPVVPLIFLVLSGVFMWNTHAYPYGPAAFGCLFIGNLWLCLTAKVFSVSVNMKAPAVK